MKYSFQGFDGKSMVKVAGRNLAISKKASYEISKFIKRKKVDWAIDRLGKVAEGKVAVPYTRFNRDVSHKAGKVGPARYPRNASLVIIKLLKNLKGAAKSKGFNVDKLVIIHAAAMQGPSRRRFGRKLGMERKNTHVELIAKEFEEKKK